MRAAISVRNQLWVRVRGPAGPRTVMNMSKMSGYVNHRVDAGLISWCSHYLLLPGNLEVLNDILGCTQNDQPHLSTAAPVHPEESLLHQLRKGVQHGMGSGGRMHVAASGGFWS